MYLTFITNRNPQQTLTFEEFFNNMPYTPNINRALQFKTVITDRAPGTFSDYSLAPFLQYITSLMEGTNLNDYYNVFQIPKRTGGYRQISEPVGPLKTVQILIKELIEERFKCLPHNAAHAYIKTRSTLSSLKVHQENNSNWFLKIDLKDFFPSHNKNYIMTQLKQIYPFSVILQDETNLAQMEQIIDYTLLNGGLPQGSPVSPTLTNICMVPIDYALYEVLGPQYRYTRYADDLLISSRQKFDTEEVIRKIKNVFRRFNAPFTIKDEKTRFGSKAGRNWNLGLMLNKDNKITIGHSQKQQFRAALDNFTRNPQEWSYEDKQHLSGLISYYSAIESDYINYQIRNYSRKRNINILSALRH